MKTNLPEKSKDHEERIKRITEIIIKTAKDKIAFVILFGSFAKGNWVFDRYSEDNTIYEYASDYDFLIITKAKRKDKKDGISSFDLERKIKNEIYQSDVIRHDHNPHFVIEPLDYVNSQLEKGRYFFCDIKKEGVVLFDSGEFQLQEPKLLSEKEVKEIAKNDYDHWFSKAKEFLEHYQFDVEKQYYNTAAFHLHQAAESLYNCALLVLAGYKPKTHDLEELNRLCSAQMSNFLTVFPLATKEQKDCFELLQKAYIESRYNKHYKIEKEQLFYLENRVNKLKEIVEEVCKNKINSIQ